MRLRKFNNIGIERFNQFRLSFAEDSDTNKLWELLEDATATSQVESEIDVEARQFTSRFAVGEYLNTLFDRGALLSLDNDRGIWTWLAAFFFEQLSPPNRRLGEDARWVPAVGDFRKYYRHLLAGPYQIYRAHRDYPQRAMALLANPPHMPGDIAEQLASRQELVTNASVMEVATKLYIDPATGLPKRGAAALGNGSARRLADLLNQLDLTWDLYYLTPEQLLNLLPTEFERFKS